MSLMPDDADLIAQARAEINANGYTVVGNLYRPETGEPECSHTIGLARHRRCGFEVAAVGIPTQAMFNVLTVIARRALAGELQPFDGLLVEAIFDDGYLIRLRPMHPSRQLPWITRVLELTDEPTVPVWQAQFPARNRTWPGDAGYDSAPARQIDLSRPSSPAPTQDTGPGENAP